MMDWRDEEDAVDIGIGTLMAAAAETASKDTGVHERRGYIGGSDAAAICGVSPWKTRFDVWLEKTGEVQPADLSGVERVQWGVILEDIVARYYAEKNGVKVRKVPGLLFHKEHPFICAHIDRNILNSRGLLEVKTTGRRWDDIPDYYYPQAQHYLAVTGYDWCDFAVLVAGQEYQQFRCPRDDEYIDALVALETEFWERYVAPGVAPEPETSEDAYRLWPRGAGVVFGDANTLRIARELYGIKAGIKEMEQAQERLELEIKNQMADIGDELVVDGKKIATWKTQTRASLDVKAIMAAEPDICLDYMKESESRVLRLTYKPEVE